MVGGFTPDCSTYLLRTLVKVVDPKVPAEAIEKAEETINQLDRQLSQASVISKEMIRKRKEEHGNSAVPQNSLRAVDRRESPPAFYQLLQLALRLLG
jgi:hypothetical protein